MAWQKPDVDKSLKDYRVLTFAQLLVKQKLKKKEILL